MLIPFFCSFPLPAQFLDDHPHLFAVDQLLLFFFVQVSPLEEYSKLIERVPLFMLLAGLSEKFPIDDRQKVICRCICNMNKVTLY